MKQCPNCRKMYEPVLERMNDDRAIQDQYPHAESWEREQLITGLCSDKCWNEFLGADEEEVEYP